MRLKLIEALRNLHRKLEHELAAERSRRFPNHERILRLKKLKLSVKDRLTGVRPLGGGSLA